MDLNFFVKTKTSEKTITEKINQKLVDDNVKDEGRLEAFCQDALRSGIEPLIKSKKIL